MTTTSNTGDHAQIPAEHATSRGSNSRSSSKRFKFKSKSKTSKWHDEDNLRHASESSSRHHHHHRHHHRHKRRRLSTSPRVNPPSPESVPASSLHPDIAFRESLFDAMGDDEGAAYWESVYGQPIHTYSDAKRNEETGELEKMSDEEYIAFVRRGMWERSWEGVEAERERRRKESLGEEREREDANRKKKKEETGESRDRGIEPNDFEREVEESLRRGWERKQKRMWREKWEAYEKAWDDLYLLARSRNTTIDATEEKNVHLRNEIVWPVESGKRKDVNTQEIERFMTKTVGSRMASGELANTESAFASTLKSERVRWHPDKVQQRFGGLNIDEETLRGVTEVFQVIDRLYNERK
ncbi:hypothetical protein EPUS_04730 [Endocarpon pusillum Z07020]|uniref:J domain-containing protein n=1 Tax=Endocarpon pusillum (strain Z07020 / HMAS-L-300199) TaxID=1263415 RepID=U1FZS2_ENDPU|nr:uncharacterized protein EPUS_04730 [Endocarpon pusillum Z07020]ERF70452.1 hypothetical protein EPUS_04730 [Endocarpon pusillum Z07020]